MTHHLSPMTYRIQIEGHLDDSWTDWFDGVTIHHEVDGHSTITASLPDQSAFVALLQRLHYLCITITDISILDNDDDPL